MKSIRSRFATLGWLFLSLFYAAIFLVILLLAYTGNLPGFLQFIPYYDTIGHFVLYFLATYLGHRVLKCRTIMLIGYKLPLWPLLFATFTITEELIQQTSPNRTFSWLDMVMSLLGIAVGCWLAERESR
jgi:VanZ family protein